MRMLIALLIFFLPQVAGAQTVDPAALEAAVVAELSTRPVQGRFAFFKEGLGSRLTSVPPGLEIATRSQALVIENGRPVAMAPGYHGYLAIDQASPTADGSVVVYLRRREAGGPYRSLGGTDLRVIVAREGGVWRVIRRDVLREY